MIVIRSWEDMARALDSPLVPKRCLAGHRDRLSEWQDYSLNEIAVFLIISAGDTLEQAEAAFGRPLVTGNHFAFLPELIERHGAWLSVTTILSDDGYGLVLLAEEGPGTDPRWTAAFSNAAGTLDKLAIR